MILIIHGENLTKSRETVLNLQKKYNAEKKTELNVTEISPVDFSNLCFSIDMFGGSQFIVLDVSGAGRMNLDAYAEILRSTPANNIVIILSGKELTKTNSFIKIAPEVKAMVLLNKEFENSNVFKFADLVFSGNRKAAYMEYSNLQNDDADPIYIFSMLLYQLRNVTLAKFNAPSFSKAAPFVKGKAESLSKKFTEEGLLEIYNDYYQMDIDAKSGGLSQDLLVPLAVEKVLKVSGL